MRRLVIIDSEDESDYVPVLDVCTRISGKDDSTEMMTSRNSTDSPETRLTSPVSVSSPDEKDGPLPRKRMRSLLNESSSTSIPSRSTPIFRSRDMVPYVEIIVDKPRTSSQSQKRKAVPFVEIISSRPSPKRKLITSQASNKTPAKDAAPVKKEARVADKGRKVQPGSSRQLTLSSFFAPPASKRVVREESPGFVTSDDKDEDDDEFDEEDDFIEEDDGKQKVKKSYGKKGVWEPKFRAGKPIKRIKDVPTLERAFVIEKEARSKEIRGDYPPISDLGDIFADIVRRTPGIKELAETLHNRPLRVATMCSGTESPLLALNLISRAVKEQHGISIEIHHVFSCEIEPYKQAYIERNFAPPILFRDVCELGDDQAHTAYGALVDVPGNVDLLVAGTSCVDYSNLNNKKKGMDEGGESGRTFFGMLNWVKKHQPALVLLENVKSAPWAGVGEAFSDIDYDAAWSNTFDTKNYYIPHTRQRGYLIATQNRKDSYAGNWEALARSLARPASSSLEDFMLAPDDPRIQKVRTQFALGEGVGKGRSTIDWSKCQQRHERARDEENLGKNRPFTSWEEGGTCRLSHDAWNEWALPLPERVLDLLDVTIMRAAKEGIDPHYKSRVWELSQNVDRNISSARPGVCMCLTPSGMPYLTSRGGPMVGLEALSLQGLPIDELLLTRETNDQLQNLAGNAMSSTVAGTCILAALVIARPDLEARRNNQDIDMVDEESCKQVEEKIVTRDGKPGTKMVGHADDEIYDITSCLKMSVSLAEGAVASSQRCTCEGRRGTTSDTIYRCTSCHHTTCATCKGRPEHNYVVDERARENPAAFAQKFKEALPMRIWLQCSSMQDLTSLSEGVTSSDKSLLKKWIQRVSSVLSDGVEIRFNELLRQRTWLASYSGFGVRLELLFDVESPHWRLFIEADSNDIAGSPLRKLLRQPVARLSIDLTKKDAFLLDGQWDICLPTSTTFNAEIRHSGELVPTWQAKMGIEGEFQGTKRYSQMRIQVPSSTQSELDVDISGQYHLLADCGTANCSLFMRQEIGDAGRLYFFLDPDRFKGKESDMFVFATDISKLPHPLERVAIARAPGGWRPKKPKSAILSSSGNVDGVEESVGFSVGGCWRPWSDLKVSTPAHFSANLALAEKKSFELSPCHHAATIVTISSSVFGSARGLWPKTEGEWHQVDLEHHAATTFRSLAWLTERLQLPNTLTFSMEIPNKYTEDCQRCAPVPPAIQWLHVKGRPPAPVENEQQAGPYEQALKKRPSPFIVQLRLEEEKGQVRIGINALTLAHRARARLPSNEAVQGDVSLSWQLSLTDPTLDLFNLPKYKLSSNRDDSEADTPGLFKIPLRKEQKRSLHWMLAQESKISHPTKKKK